MIKKIILGMITLSLLVTSCENDDFTPVPGVVSIVSPDGGVLEGGPFGFCIDSTIDNVSGITLTGNVAGANQTYVVTTIDSTIVGLPPNIAAVEGIDFNDNAPGTCLIWHLSFEDGLEGAEIGGKANKLQGVHNLSNPIEVVRGAETVGGTLTGGPFTFVTGDGIADYVTGVSLSGASDTNSSYVVTDADLNILGLPPTLEELGTVNFDVAGEGTCLIWHLAFTEGLMGAEMGMNAGDLVGCFDLSNSIEVIRNEVAKGGVLNAPAPGEYTFCVDGVVDNISGLTLEGNSESLNNTFVVTDATGVILGLPPTMEALEGVDFDAAQAGVCLIWHLSFKDGLQGAVVGQNASGLIGDFDLSNPITVTRTDQPEGGAITGDTYVFTVGDGVPDMIPAGSITLDGMQSGTNSTWVITDGDLNILGLPPTLTDVEAVDFDGTEAGECLVWYLRFEDGLQGAQMGMNAADLTGCYDLSNPITVIRN